MKYKGLIITLIIILLVLIFGLSAFLVIALKSGANFKNGMFNISSDNTNIIYDKEFDLENIKNINIQQDAGKIKIIENSDNFIKVVLYGENESDVKVELNNEKLNIESKHSTRSFNFFNFNITTNDIIIYIPSGYSNEIKIKNNYGNCEIEDLENVTINIDSDAGNIELGKIKNALLKSSCGNIKINEVLNKCDIDNNCGNIKIGTMNIQENSTIKADLGNIEINNTNDIFIDADVDLGKIKINKNDKSSDIVLKIEADCGNVTINN